MRHADMGRKQSAFNRPQIAVFISQQRHGSSTTMSAPLRLLLLAGIVCMLLIITLHSAKVANAADLQVESDPVNMAVDIAKPAVVRIYATVIGRLIVHLPTGEVVFPQNRTAYTLTLSGSGTFISSYGDILTADHLITPPSQVFADVAAPDVTNYVNQHLIYGGQLMVDQVDQALASGQIGSDAVYSSKRSEVYLSTDYTGMLSATTLQDLPSTVHKTVDRVEEESNFNQKDVALIHAPFIDTPSVQLADSSEVEQQDELTIIGFPGNGDISDNPSNLLTSSVNKVIVSSIKTTDTGVPVIQVGGNVEHGDSGGPALDSNGRIVGIVSFGVSDGSPGETSFLQTSESARELVQELNLYTTPGIFEQEWSQAFTNYSSTTPGHWHKAAQELAKIAASYPLFLAVTPYLVNAQAQAKIERIPQTHLKSNSTNSPGPSITLSLPALAWTTSAIALLVLLLFLLTGIARYRGKKGVLTEARGHAHVARLPHLLPAHGEKWAKEAQQTPTHMQDHGSTTFGTPGRVSQQSSVSETIARSTVQPLLADNASSVFRPWQCGHANRPHARFCCMCGQPAPLLPMLRSAEQ